MAMSMQQLKNRLLRAKIRKYTSSVRIRRVISHVAVHAALVVGVAVILLPFYWMISTSLKRPGTEFAFPIEWIPRPPRWQNYPAAWTVLPFGRWLTNTLIITASCILGDVLSSSIVAFGFARIRFRGRDSIFLLVLATMMLPHTSVIVPQFILFKLFGWVDSFRPLIVPSLFATNAFYIFVLRQFFKTIPIEIDDAARVDGCSTFGIFYRMALPLSQPALGMIMVFSFMSHWNDFMGPLIFLSSSEKYTLALGLRFFQGQYRVEWALLMAASLIILSPCVILFFLAQKYYIQGVVVTGIKG